MEVKDWISACVLLMILMSCTCMVQEIFEFEDALGDDQQSSWVWRSEASGLKTFRITSMEGRTAVSLFLCVRPRGNLKNVTFYIDNIRYGNDGPSDQIQLIFEEVELATIHSYEKWHNGHEWNVLKNTGQKGPLINLLEGDYKLDVFVKTDQWGMELDFIQINSEHQLRSQPIICDAIAYDDSSEN
ncbi:hypothetical protein ACF0H5_000641 [Mactra antiquata]